MYNSYAMLLIDCCMVASRLTWMQPLDNESLHRCKCVESRLTKVQLLRYVAAWSCRDWRLCNQWRTRRYSLGNALYRDGRMYDGYTMLLIGFCMVTSRLTRMQPLNNESLHRCRRVKSRRTKVQQLCNVGAQSSLDWHWCLSDLGLMFMLFETFRLVFVALSDKLLPGTIGSVSTQVISWVLWHS
jgi:hypothetical protein